jgi:hypothetical protein
LGMGLYRRPRLLYLHSANPYEALDVIGCVVGGAGIEPALTDSKPADLPISRPAINDCAGTCDAPLGIPNCAYLARQVLHIDGNQQYSVV